MIKFLLAILKFNLFLYEGEPDSGGAADTPPADAPPADTPPADKPPASAKPELLEDSFWDAEKNEVRLPELIKSFKETKAAFSAKEESIREKVMAEIQKQRPESPEKYEVKADLGIEVPEGLKIEFADDDPMLGMWRDMCYQNNASQDQFMEGIRRYVQNGIEHRVDPKAEREKLGENGQARIDRLDMILNKHLSTEEVDQIADTFNTADGVQVLEKLIEGLAGGKLPDMGDGDPNLGDKAMTRAELENMMRDPRYTGIGRPRDEEWIKRVAEGFRKLSPGKRRIA